MMRLENKIALVTGGASGIGAATAKRFAEEGATVIVADVSQAGVEAVSGSLNEAESAVFDVSDAAEVDKAISSVVARHGRIDVLVNNAGILVGSPEEGQRRGEQTEAALIAMMQGAPLADPWDILSHSSLEAWELLLKINLTGAFNCTKACAPSMTRGGSIINVSSLSAVTGPSGVPGYAAAKAGMCGLTRNLAFEFGPKGIRVNAVLPGPIKTPLMKDHSELVRQAFISQIPLGRLGEPEEVADLNLFLASDQASFLTGQQISPNGGMWM